MIDHLRSNKGKVFMYIVPVSPYPYKDIADYIICKVQITQVRNRMSEFLILDVIREETGNGIYNYYKRIKEKVWGSNKYLYPITDKFKKEIA